MAASDRRSLCDHMQLYSSVIHNARGPVAPCRCRPAVAHARIGVFHFQHEAPHSVGSLVHREHMGNAWDYWKDPAAAGRRRASIETPATGSAVATTPVGAFKCVASRIVYLSNGFPELCLVMSSTAGSAQNSASSSSSPSIGSFNQSLRTLPPRRRTSSSYPSTSR